MVNFDEPLVLNNIIYTVPYNAFGSLSICRLTYCPAFGELCLTQAGHLTRIQETLYVGNELVFWPCDAQVKQKLMNAKYSIIAYTGVIWFAVHFNGCLCTWPCNRLAPCTPKKKDLEVNDKLIHFKKIKCLCCVQGKGNNYWQIKMHHLFIFKNMVPFMPPDCN